MIVYNPKDNRPRSVSGIRGKIAYKSNPPIYQFLLKEKCKTFTKHNIY